MVIINSLAHCVQCITQVEVGSGGRGRVRSEDLTPTPYHIGVTAKTLSLGSGMMLNAKTPFLPFPPPILCSLLPPPLYCTKKLPYVKPSLKKAFEFDRTQSINYIVLFSANAVLEACTAKRVSSETANQYFITQEAWYLPWSCSHNLSNLWDGIRKN